MRILTRPSGDGAGPRRQPRGLHAAAALAIALSLGTVPLRAADVIDRVLAVVSGEIITLSDVQGALAIGLVEAGGAGDPLAAGLRQLIDRTLILGEVRRFAPAEPGGTDVDARVDQMRRRFDSPAALARALAASGISEERLSLLARDDLRIRAYLAERFAGSLQPTDGEVEQYLRERQKAADAGGRQLSPGEAPDLARQQLADGHRQALVAEWVADLRRRADITELYPGR